MARRSRIVLLSMLFIGLSLFVGTPSEAQGGTVYRAGIVVGPGCFDSDALHLRDALAKGTNWDVGNIKALGIGTKDLLQQHIIKHLEQADADDVSLFYICDHGGAQRDEAPVDDPNNDSAAKKMAHRCEGECDESIGLTQESIWDDELDALFANVKGNKIIIFDSCYAEGLQDGTSDLRPKTTNTIVMWSAGTNEKAKTIVPWTDTHGHAMFTGFLISGLADDGAGFARADKDKNLEVTVKEWLDYAKPKTMALNPDQTPGLDDSREPAGSKADKKVVFKYAKGDLLDHRETDGAGAKKDQCFECDTVCPEYDPFPESHAEIEMLIVFDSETGSSETVQMDGPTTVKVLLGSLGDHDGDGLEEVPTEIVQMELVGLSLTLGTIKVRLRDATLRPFQHSQGEIEENVNSTMGALDIPPFADKGTASSFFDVFVEIELAEGLVCHNEAPIRLEADPYISWKPPRPGETYTGPPVPVEMFDEAGDPCLGPGTRVDIVHTSHTPVPAAGVGGAVNYMGEAVKSYRPGWVSHR